MTACSAHQLSRGADSQATSFVADSQGNLHVVGWANNVTGTHWIVRENPGGTGTWSTVDNFQYATGASAAAAVANASGNVFAGGSGGDSTGVQHWLVRRR